MAFSCSVPHLGFRFRCQFRARRPPHRWASLEWHHRHITSLRTILLDQVGQYCETDEPLGTGPSALLCFLPRDPYRRSPRYQRHQSGWCCLDLRLDVLESASGASSFPCWLSSSPDHQELSSSWKSPYLQSTKIESCALQIKGTRTGR